MSAFSAAYLLIVRLMLIGWDVLIRRGAGMDFLLKPPPPFARQPALPLVEKSKLSLMQSRLGKEEGNMHFHEAGQKTTHNQPPRC